MCHQTSSPNAHRLSLVEQSINGRSATRRFVRFSVLIASLSILFVMVLPTNHVLRAQDNLGAKKTKPVAPSRLAVDSLQHEGKLFVGFIVKQNDESVVMAVEREWLRSTHPSLINRYLTIETKAMQGIIKRFRNRFDDWSGDVAANESLAKDIASEFNRIIEENKGEALQRKRFMLLSFDRQSVSKVRNQPIKKKRIAALAWDNRVERVSTKSHADLLRELRDLKVDLEDAYFDLSGDMPAADLTDRQWHVRRGIYEFEYTGEMEFQGQGDQLFLIGDDTNIPQVMASMMGGSMLGGANSNSIAKLGRELGLPEFAGVPREKDWIKEVTDEADKKDCRSVLVKRILDGNNSDIVTVEATLLIKARKKWETVKQVSYSAKLSDQTAEQLQAIKRDPQVQQAIGIAEKLGLGAGMMDRALQKGAATHEAIKKVGDMIQLLISENTRRIEAPWSLN